MDWLDASSFRLVENQRTLALTELRLLLRDIVAKSKANDALVLDGQSVQAVILGLLACLDTGQSVFLVRDQAAMPLGAQWQGNQDWQLIAAETANSAPTLWLQTSGTTGLPKWVPHDPRRLCQTISKGVAGKAVWLLTYDPASFAGLQVILSALIGGHTLIYSDIRCQPAALVELALQNRVSHLSGTPTFWRSLLRAADGATLSLQHITLGGELADQPTLDMLSSHFPQARIRHIYATTETGVVFHVQDGLSGFPSSWIDTTLPNDIHLALSERGTLLVSSPRMRIGLDKTVIDTGDVIEIKDERAFFKGRVDSMINIGGQKVFPEEIEAYLLRLPIVVDVRVSSLPSPITGAILIADILPREGHGSAAEMKRAIQEHLKGLPRHARPVLLRFNKELPTLSSNKKARFT